MANDREGEGHRSGNPGFGGAEHEDDRRGERKTYHRRFRFPKSVDDDGIEAQYTNGILEVRLPIARGATVTGREIEIES